MKGLVLVYTGNGKGKTTASLGLGFRAVGQGLKVFMMQFMKGQGQTGELNSVQKFDNFIIEQAGRPQFVIDAPDPMDIKAAEQGFKKVEEIVNNNSCDMLILDEINMAMAYGLIEVEKVRTLIKTKPKTMHLVLTGRSFPNELTDVVDMISEVTEIKHHYNSGVMAKKGIEY